MFNWFSIKCLIKREEEVYCKIELNSFFIRVKFLFHCAFIIF